MKKDITEIKKVILNKLGENHTDTIVFNCVKNNYEIYGLYTYENDVYVLRNSCDLSFDSEEITLDEQQKVYEMFIANDWKIDKTLQ